jgi:hypothetical protein
MTPRRIATSRARAEGDRNQLCTQNAWTESVRKQ